MLGCIQPISSPMMNRILGFVCCCGGGVCCADAGAPTISTGASAASRPKQIFLCIIGLLSPAMYKASFALGADPAGALMIAPSSTAFVASRLRALAQAPRPGCGPARRQQSGHGITLLEMPDAYGIFTSCAYRSILASARGTKRGSGLATEPHTEQSVQILISE